jgi:hypothetical protein
MSKRINILRDPETGEYKLASSGKDGQENVFEIVPIIEHMNVTDACKVLLGYAKERQTLREAACSLLGDIIHEYPDRLGAWKGQVAKDGPIPKEFKDAFRDCETDFFKKFMDKDHPAHKIFVGGLPKMNDKGQTLEVNGKPNVEAQFQYFLSATRSEGNYANAKNMVSGLYCFVGIEPINDDGNLIPPEVMRAMVSNAKGEGNVRDNTFKAKLYSIFTELVTKDGWKREPTDNWPEMKRTINELAQWVNQYADIAAKTKTEAGVKPDAAKATQEAMAAAQKPHEPESIGEAHVVKVTEEA